MKHLPKHLRPRWRYLAVELESTPAAAFDREALQGAVWYAAASLLGDSASADADLSVVRFRRADGDDIEGNDRDEGETGETADYHASTAGGAEATAVVRVRRSEVERARAVLACVDAVEGVPVRTRVRGVSGTVRACEEKYLKRPRAGSRDRTVAFAGAERRASTRGRRVDVELADGLVGATELDYRDTDH
ncbi:ribonuclease P [Halobacteriales archaeon QS_4_70_19]|nr:MAG: ribonuclease P [Halobacteriales archaeon QS_4_70_19]